MINNNMKFDKLVEGIVENINNVTSEDIKGHKWNPEPKPGCGWRYLRSKEMIQSGDERYNYIHDKWVPVPPDWIGQECEDEKIRTFRQD